MTKTLHGKYGLLLRTCSKIARRNCALHVRRMTRRKVRRSNTNQFLYNNYYPLKTKPMSTQENVDKTARSRKVPTEIEYLEKGHWKKGEQIITVLGGLEGEAKRPIGHIILIDYDENKRPILAAVDLEGQEIFERT